MKRSLLTVSLLLLLIVIAFTSYAWYKFFDKDDTLSSQIEIIVVGGNNVVNTFNTMPLADEERFEIKPYVFSINNRNKVTTKFIVKLIETPLEQVKDGCNKDKLLNRSQLRYELISNGKTIEIGNLSDISNNVLYTDTLNSESRRDYSLRIWVKKEAYDTDWNDKHYHYSLSVLEEVK